MSSAAAFYDWLASHEVAGECRSMQIGRVWSLCIGDVGAGLAMSPQAYSRSLDFPGSVAGSALQSLTADLLSWEPFRATTALAALNAANPFDASRFTDATAIDGGNLAVFDHFLPRIKGARIVVVGRYPGLEKYEAGYDLKVIERMPGEHDYPDPAAEFLIPEADWLFLTASSIANKTFPRLAELGEHCSTVLMGPSLPWLDGWSEWGIDFIAGTAVADAELLSRLVAEGAGKTIFDAAIGYRIVDTGQARMQQLKEQIAWLASQRDYLNSAMDRWYETNRSRFPDFSRLEAIRAELSQLDTAYKQMWDGRQS